MEQVRVELAQPYQMPLIAEFHAEFLAERQSQDYNLLDNEETRNHFIIEFGRAIIENRGVFVALDDQGLAGVLWWIITDSPIRTRFKVATTLGHRVRPGLDDSEIKVAMEAFATDWLRARGVDKVLDLVEGGDEITI